MAQCRILADIQTCQLVVRAVQSGQCQILAHVQPSQLVARAVQMDQLGKILHACQVSNGGNTR